MFSTVCVAFFGWQLLRLRRPVWCIRLVVQSCGAINMTVSCAGWPITAAPRRHACRRHVCAASAHCAAAAGFYYRPSSARNYASTTTPSMKVAKHKVECVVGGYKYACATDNIQCTANTAMHACSIYLFIHSNRNVSARTKNTLCEAQRAQTTLAHDLVRSTPPRNLRTHTHTPPNHKVNAQIDVAYLAQCTDEKKVNSK